MKRQYRIHYQYRPQNSIGKFIEATCLIESDQASFVGSEVIELLYKKFPDRENFLILGITKIQ